MNEYTNKQKIYAVLAYADEHEDFDPTFVEMMEEVEENQGLSKGQERALDNVIDGFKIDLDEWTLA